MAPRDPFWPRIADGLNQALQQTGEITREPESLAARFFAIEVLSSDPIAEVTFGLPYCSVDPVIFAEVRAAILRGGIRMRVMGAGDPDFQHAQAVYIAGQDLMKIAEGDWEKRHRFRTAVVHEAVHAHHDMEGRSDLRVHQSEAAAFIAETVFTRNWPIYRKNDIRPQFLCDPQNDEFNAIFRPAWALALRIVDGGETTIADGDADLTELQDGIRDASVYADSWDRMITADRIRW